MISLQMEHLHEQRELHLAHLRVRRWQDRFSLTLQVLGIIMGGAIVAAIAVMAWQAHEDHGVVIEAFSTPPDLSARGLSGQVVASQVLDRLSALQAETVTRRPADSYKNDWGDDVRVEIPETGVSIGELKRYLRQWLGRQTEITGEVVRTPVGLAITARAAGAPGKTFQGPEADFDNLIQQAAEAIYAQTQPYRWSVFLQSHGRFDEALAGYIKLARTGPPEDGVWAYHGWASMLMQRGEPQAATDKAHEALRKFGPHEGAYIVLMASEHVLEHMQGALGADKGRLDASRDPGAKQFTRSIIAMDLGDYRAAASGLAQFGLRPDEGYADSMDASVLRRGVLVESHDIDAARSSPGAVSTGWQMQLADASVGVEADMALEDWPAAMRDLQAAGSAIAAVTPPDSQIVDRNFWPRLALVYAHLGRPAEADALAARTPLDCDICLRMRGQVAAAKGDWKSADRWFAEAIRQEPSLPFALSDWGQALLAKGDLDGAIAKLGQAHDKSAHFANPLKLWGEALMKKGDFRGAVAKFEEADQFAPHWGENHLRWGQALAKFGKIDEAKAQWRAAQGMALSAGDRRELALALSGTR